MEDDYKGIFKDSGRKKIEDVLFENNLQDKTFHHQQFIRVGARTKSFKKVNFSHSYFEHCYFNNVNFDSCTFTGCKFINCNFANSSFASCNFEYATFEKTFITNSILTTNSPDKNNLLLKFARTLRVNYQGIGDAESVNKAIKVELKATKKHLHEAWKSEKTYYTGKYHGLKKIKMFFKWLNFLIQDFVWGNGESLRKLIFMSFYLWVLFSVIDTIKYKDYNIVSNYIKSFISLPAIFMSIEKPNYYSDILLTIITALRLLLFALFTSMLIKKFNKR